MKTITRSRRFLGTWLVPVSILLWGGCSSSQKTASAGKVPAENPSLFQSFMLGVFNSDKDDDSEKTETEENAAAAGADKVVVASDEQSIPPKGQATTASGSTKTASTGAASKRPASTGPATAGPASTDASSPPPQYGPANPLMRR